MATFDDQAFGDPGAERADEILRARFGRYRYDTVAALRPAGAESARRVYRRRRAGRLLTVGAAVLLVAAGGVYAASGGVGPHPAPVAVPTSTQPNAVPTGSTPGRPSASPTTTGHRLPGGPTPVRPSSSTPAGAPACRAADLALSRVGSEGHAGSLTTSFAFTNRSGRACSLTGFPRVRAVDDQGSAYPVDVRRVGSGPRRIIDPGGSVYTSVTTSNVQAAGYEDAPCDPAAAALWLAPPSGSGHLVAAGPWRICNKWDIQITGFDTDRPVVPGS